MSNVAYIDKPPLRPRLTHLLRAEGVDLSGKARESFLELLTAQTSIREVRQVFLELMPGSRRVKPLELLLAEGDVRVHRLRDQGFDPDGLLGTHELFDRFVHRSVARCLEQDGLPLDLSERVRDAFIQSMSPGLATLQRGILGHARPDQIVNLGRFVDTLDLGPARRAYLEVTQVPPEQSVVGYIEWALHGSSEQRRRLIRWDRPSDTHLVLECGVAIPTTVDPRASMFSALEMIRWSEGPVEPPMFDAPQWERPVEPAFLGPTAPALHFPLVDAMLISLALPVLGDRCAEVLIEPVRGEPRADIDRVSRELSPWIHADAPVLASWLGGRSETDPVEAGWALVWTRLLAGLDALLRLSENRPSGFRSMVAAWLRVRPLARHPEVRHRGKGGRFELDPVESPLDQQMVRLLMKRGRHPRELLRWMLSEWGEAAEAIRALARLSGRNAPGVSSILHEFDGQRSLSAEKKAISIAGRQAWCLAEVDRLLRQQRTSRDHARTRTRHLPAEAWAASRVVKQGVFDPSLLGWP